MNGLYTQLLQYKEDGDYPLHMPGHKRNTELLSLTDPVSIDITEIENFDNLQHPEGVLLSLEERLTTLYDSAKSFVLVNGSSGGILAAIGMLTGWGDKIVIGRNCHKAAYNGCLVNGLRPVYAYPEWREQDGIQGQVTSETIARLLKENPDAKLVFLVSPTYEGVVSDIREIANIVHSYGIPLVVDEAHGAHLTFHKEFPESALTMGADVVIQSLHKTLPSLTQTAALHLGKEAHKLGITPERMRSYINMYQTTSPSYVLMASVEQCVALLEEKKDKLFEQYIQNLKNFYEQAALLKNCRVLPWQEGRDPGKIIISVRGTGMSGTQISEYLRKECRIEMEMESGDYCLGMTSVCDTKEGFDRLLAGLRQLDDRLSRQETKDLELRMPLTEQVMTPAEAMDRKGDYCKITEAAGCVALEYIYLYPPGIPLVVPGEMISEEIVAFCEKAVAEGFRLRGIQRQGEVLCMK